MNNIQFHQVLEILLNAKESCGLTQACIICFFLCELSTLEHMMGEGSSRTDFLDRSYSLHLACTFSYHIIETLLSHVV